jgi:hypothetical protein
LTDSSDRIASLERRIKELEDDRKSFFKTGIWVLGAGVLLLGSYIWKSHAGG